MKSAVQSELANRTLKIARKTSILRPRDLDTYGIPRKYLNILYHKGLLNRVGRGLYVLADAGMKGTSCGCREKLII